jgi:hypothetical protein
MNTEGGERERRKGERIEATAKRNPSVLRNNLTTVK